MIFRRWLVLFFIVPVVHLHAQDESNLGAELRLKYGNNTLLERGDTTAFGHYGEIMAMVEYPITPAYRVGVGYGLGMFFLESQETDLMEFQMPLLLTNRILSGTGLRAAPAV